MPPKPRSGPSRRPTTGGRDRTQLFWVVGALALLAVGIVVWLLVGRGDDTAAAGDVRTALEAAGCTLDESPARPGHSLDRDAGGYVGRLEDRPADVRRPLRGARHLGRVHRAGEPWRSSCTTSSTAASSSCTATMYRTATVAQLRAFYDENENGTVLAPYPKLGDEIELGAWVSKSPSTRRRRATSTSPPARRSTRPRSRPSSTRSSSRGRSASRPTSCFPAGRSRPASLATSDPV